MLQSAFYGIAARAGMYEDYTYLFRQFDTVPSHVTIDRSDGKHYDTSLMALVLEKFHRMAVTLADAVYCLSNDENSFFKEALKAQIQENSNQRLFTKLCTNSTVWEQFMLSGFIKTINFPLAQYQQYANDIERHTTLIQEYCRISAIYLETVITLTSSIWTDDPEKIKIATALFINIGRILVLIRCVRNEQTIMIKSLRIILRQLIYAFPL